MKTLLLSLIAALAVAVSAVPTAAVAAPSPSASSAASVEIRLKSGATWRGKVGDTVRVVFVERGVDIEITGTVIAASSSPAYVTVKTDLAGSLAEKTIFGADLKVLEAYTPAEKAEEKPNRYRPKRATSKPGTAASSIASGAKSDNIPRDDKGRPLGVFVLPLEGGVGQEFRHQEILELGRYIDENYGPGHTIVLLINSNGGLVIEALEISKAIHEVRKRHRVVAWIDKAISAGCSTAMSCYEIYFRTTGTAGSVTTLQGSTSLQGAEAERHVEDFVKLAKASGYSEHIARSMKLNKYMCSYDKDPETGEVTFYGDLSGEHHLSTKDQNLSFNCDNALHSGFSKGTADTGEELAELLGLPEWYEISDYGREIANDWQETYTRVTEDITKQYQRLGYKNAGRSLEVRIGTQIRIMERLIRYWEQHELVSMMSQPMQKRDLERAVEELRKQLADMRRRGR